MDWTSLQGSFAVIAIATDNDGGVTTSTTSNITVSDPAVNQLPTVTLTNPTEGQVITKATTIALSASATDADGTIDYVEFFIDGVLIGGDITAPYSVNYTMSYVGSYAVFAIATDNEGGVTTSTYVNITVTEPSTCTTPGWEATTAYSGGAQVSYGGTVYEAKWWTLNSQPDLFSGPYDQWKIIGACGAPEAGQAAEKVQSVEGIIEVSTTVFPNPSTGIVTISAVFNQVADVVVNVLDLKGSIVSTLSITQTNGISQTLDLRDLTNGIYFVNTLVNGNTSVQKVVINH
jgi:chitodextrinase